MRVVDSLTRLRAADTFFLDMDGTLYVDEFLLPGTQDLLAAIARRGLEVVLRLTADRGLFVLLSEPNKESSLLSGITLIFY